MKICMAGARGRMGRRILSLAAAANDVSVGGAFDLPVHAGETLAFDDGGAITLSQDAAAALAHSEVLIDFTAAHACLENVRAAADAGKAAVVGTTGLSKEQRAELAAMGRRIPLVVAPNMSVGVNLLFKLTQETAKALGPDYNVEIVEIHHNQKADSPSGTAVRLGERAAEGLGMRYPDDAVHGREGIIGPRPQQEIGMHAVRGGDVVGDHTVLFIGPGERIELTHRAHSRDTFAQGALRAARFAVSAPPGVYDMQDVLGLT